MRTLKVAVNSIVEVIIEDLCIWDEIWCRMVIIITDAVHS